MPYEKRNNNKGLPRRLTQIETERCVGLDNDGKRCENTAKYQTTYLGRQYKDLPEVNPGWVVVKLCQDHVSVSDRVESDRDWLEENRTGKEAMAVILKEYNLMPVDAEGNPRKDVVDIVLHMMENARNHLFVTRRFPVGAILGPESYSLIKETIAPDGRLLTPYGLITIRNSAEEKERESEPQGRAASGSGNEANQRNTHQGEISAHGENADQNRMPEANGDDDSDYKCDICGMGIPFGNPIVVIMQDIEYAERGESNGDDVINVIQSDSLMTLCGSCGNRFQADALAGLMQNLLKPGGKGNGKKHRKTGPLIYRHDETFAECDVCGKSIPYGNPDVVIKKNIEHLDHNLLANRDEIEVVRSDVLTTLCGHCGNRLDTDVLAGLAKNLPLSGDEGKN